MKMLSDKQIKVYLRWLKSKNKRHKNKAKSRFTKDFGRYSALRVQIMQNKTREFTKKAKLHDESIYSMFEPTGRNIFDVM